MMPYAEDNSADADCKAVVVLAIRRAVFAGDQGGLTPRKR